MVMAFYINSGGGAAVGTSFSITSEEKPNLRERQILYSEIPPILSSKCTSEGFDVFTSLGVTHFTDRDAISLRAAPKELDKQYLQQRGAVRR